MVLLLARYKAGEIPAPLCVRMAPAHLLEEAWRAAAINHLNGNTVEKEQEHRQRQSEGRYEEYHEELNWEEKRERAR